MVSELSFSMIAPTTAPKNSSDAIKSYIEILYL